MHVGLLAIDSTCAMLCCSDLWNTNSCWKQVFCIIQIWKEMAKLEDVSPLAFL